MKLFISWLLNKLPGLLAERKADIRTMKVHAENFAEFITLIAQGKLTNQKGLEVMAKMLDDGSDPSHAMEELGAKRVDDADALNAVLDTVIESNPEEVERFKNGEKKLMQFFIGQIMKETRGNADPGLAARMVNDRIK